MRHLLLVQHVAALDDTSKRAQDGAMKLLPVLIIALAGCLDQDPIQDPPDTEDHSVLESCGRPPVAPRWSYTIDPAKPDFAVVSMRDFEAHNAWADAIAKWSICADNSQ